MDAIIPFGPLPVPVIHKVVQKFVMQLETQLTERGVTFDLKDDAVEWLADKGYDERMGARPLARVIQEHIKKPLADEVLFGKLKEGGTVKVTVETDELGEKKLKLDAMADELPVKPKKQTPRKAAAKPKAKAVAAKTTAKAKKSPPKADEGDDRKPGRSTVPRVPRK